MSVKLPVIRGRREWSTSAWAWGVFHAGLVVSVAVTTAAVIVLLEPRLRDVAWLRSRAAMGAGAGATVIGGALGLGGLIVRAARAAASEASSRRGVVGDAVRGLWLLVIPIAAVVVALIRDPSSTGAGLLGWLAIVLTWSWGACGLAYLTYGADKFVAIERGRGRPGFSRRVPESVLQSFALFGGLPGSLWAQRAFRHKTSDDKRRFRLGVWGLAVLHYAVLGGLAYSLITHGRS